MLGTTIGVLFAKVLLQVGFMITQYSVLNFYGETERFKEYDNIMFYAFWMIFSFVDVSLYSAFSVLNLNYLVITGFGSLLAVLLLAGNIYWIVCESKKAKKSSSANKESI